MIFAGLTFLFVAVSYLNKPDFQPHLPSPTISNIEPEPPLIFGQITREDRIKHIEWAYKNGKNYEQVALEEGGPKDYVVTFYQPNYREENTAHGGGIMVFEVKNNQPKLIWESSEIITLTMPEVLEVRDITGDKKAEIISTWSDGKVSILYLYSWDGKTFKYITPIEKVTGLIGGSKNLYAPIFGIRRGDIEVKDLDKDSIDEVIISGGVTYDELGNEIPVEQETIYKWDPQKQQYYLWKEEKIGEEKPERIVP